MPRESRSANPAADTPVPPAAPLPLPKIGELPEERHVFDEETVWAIKAALGAKRPLLVKGEPGVGKSQLARAAAVWLRRPFLSHVVDSKTESRDLLWTLDAVQRLADAQIIQQLKKDNTEKANKGPLHVSNYIRPGPIWWGFDWGGAVKQAGKAGESPPKFAYTCDATNGVVILIDEIDKGESDVPNGLLECLGNGQFQPAGYADPIVCAGRPPLVVITSNGERAMPDAFVRRCLVLTLKLPEGDGKDDVDQVLVDFLVKRGAAHFPMAAETLLRNAAEQVSRDRTIARREGVTPLPGQAEYLDLVRAVLDIAGDDVEQQDEVIRAIAGFILRKNSGPML